MQGTEMARAGAAAREIEDALALLRLALRDAELMPQALDQAERAIRRAARGGLAAEEAAGAEGRR